MTVDSLSSLGINPVFKELAISSWKIGPVDNLWFFVTKRERGSMAEDELDVRIKLGYSNS